MDISGFAPHALIGIPVTEKEDDSSPAAPLQDIADLSFSTLWYGEDMDEPDVLYMAPLPYMAETGAQFLHG